MLLGFFNSFEKRKYGLALLAFVCLPGVFSGCGGDTLEESIFSVSWVPLLMSLLGGLALFLYGMEQMAGGLKSAVGKKMKAILARFTSNRIKAAITGSVVTAVIQSSSVTTVLSVGFVSAGLMTLSQSVGVIMGANVGTTVTAQIVAFKVEKAALALIAIGFALLFIGKRDVWRQQGNILMGLGLVFFGMSIMSDGVYPLRSFQPFLDFMTSMQNPLLGILAGAIFTALVQSSSATTGIVIALASQGLIELPAGISLIFGANVGTCVTAMLATIGKSRDALRVAFVHVVFNVFGVVLWIGFIPHLSQLVQTLTPGVDEHEGMARLAAEVPRQIANAHTIFNISNTVLLIPFTALLARLARIVIPDKPVEEPAELQVVRARFLDADVLQVPALALQNARLETARLAKHVLGMMQRVPGVLEIPERQALKKIRKADDVADDLQAEILKYMGQIRKLDLTDEESEDIRKLMVTNDALERIGDVIANDIVALCRKQIKKGLGSSEELIEKLRDLQLLLIESMEHLVNLIQEPNFDNALKIVERKRDIELRIEAVFQHQEQRFKEVETDRIPIFRIEMDLVEKQRRIFGLIERIAQQV